MKEAVAELLTAFTELESKRDGSFEDITAQLSKDVELHGSSVLRGNMHELAVEVYYHGFNLMIRATTDLRSFNVYPGTLRYLGDEYKYTYANDAVCIHGEDTADLSTCQMISKLIQRIIEVY
jgi:hypothetical protein